MAVKVTNIAPRNGDTNVSLTPMGPAPAPGILAVKFQFDEQATFLIAYIENGGIRIPTSSQTGVLVAADTNYTIQFQASFGTYYNLTIQGSGVDNSGIGSSMITFQTMPRGFGSGPPLAQA